MSSSDSNPAKRQREEEKDRRPVAMTNMPEDPPEYGEDGLHMLNGNGECLDDEVVIGGEALDDSSSGHKQRKGGKEGKKLSSSGSSDEGASPRVLDDYKQPSNLDLAQEKIMQARIEQQERITRRRHPANPILRAVQKVVPYGGIFASAFSIASSTIGGGIIAMPAAYQMSGIGMATIYLLVVLAFSIYSFVLLATVAKKTGIFSWELIALRLMGRGWDYFVTFVMWVLCFGGDISYTIAIRTILSGFLDNSPTASPYLKSTAGARLITAMVWLIVVLPMCLMKEINSLRMISAVAIILVIFFALTVVVHSGQTLHSTGMRTDLVIFQKGNTAINGLSNLLFAYISQVNALTIFLEMHKFSVRGAFFAALLGLGSCSVLYFITGLFGYFDFGPGVSDSILAMYNPIENHVMAVSYVGMLLKLCVGFALHLIPCRDAVYYIMGTEAIHMPWWKNAIVSTLQASLALVAGLFIPKISTIFGLLGGFCGGFIGFIFPAFFMMYSGGFSLSQVGWGHFIGTYLLLIVGVIAVVWGTSAAIFGAANTDWST